MTPQQPGYAGASARIDGDDVHDNEPTGPTAAAGSRAAGLSSAETGSARRLPTVSLELFPPRPGKAASATWGRIDRLLATGPDFVSVTYRPTFVTDPAGGINGGEYEGSVRGTEVSRCKAVPCVRAVQEQTNPSEFVLAHVLESSTIPLMAHLTCIGYRKQEAVEIVTRFLRMGVRRFLALRGDPPAGTRADEVAGELRHADDLVRVIREVEADFFGDGKRHVTIAVAAYPATSDHIEAIEVLAAKQAAGADMAITQVFYDAADYVGSPVSRRSPGCECPPACDPRWDRPAAPPSWNAASERRLTWPPRCYVPAPPVCTCTPSTAPVRPSTSSATCVWVASWPEPRPIGRCATPLIAGTSRPLPDAVPPSCAAALPVQHCLPATPFRPTPPSPRRMHERHP